MHTHKHVFMYTTGRVGESEHGAAKAGKELAEAGVNLPEDQHPFLSRRHEVRTVLCAIEAGHSLRVPELGALATH
jgi:hypothetical protein